jgi:hypothetical protein
MITGANQCPMAPFIATKNKKMIVNSKITAIKPSQEVRL